MVATYNYTWEQGEDLQLTMLYKRGPAGEEVPVDLTMYGLRMDVVGPDGGRRYTFNSMDLDDVDPHVEGNQPDTFKEAGLQADGVIKILLPRSLTLPGGELYGDITANPPVLTFAYDVFLRDNIGYQKKVLKGQITIEKSVTLWP